MKVIVESFGFDSTDDFFKNVARHVINDLVTGKFGDIGAGGKNLIFSCLKQKRGEMFDASLVTVYSSPSANERDVELLAAIKEAVERMGRTCVMCPNREL